jgi:hypothetical protein
MKREKEGIYQKNQFTTHKKNAYLIRSVTQPHTLEGTTSQQDQQRENKLFKYIYDISHSGQGSMGSNG